MWHSSYKSQLPQKSGEALRPIAQGSILRKTMAKLSNQDYRKTAIFRFNPIPNDEITSKPSHDSDAFPGTFLELHLSER